MKIKLEINTDTIICADVWLKKVYDMPPSPHKTENIYRSIAFDLSDAFSKKAKNLVKKNKIFDNKPLTITIKFHEAWALQQILNDLLPEVHNSHHNNLLQKLIFQCNQKTA